MKRAALGVLILILVALPTFAQKPAITGARCVSLEHVRDGWRMEIKCDQSSGVIVMLDDDKYAGKGVFEGWSQSELKAFYQSLIPKADSTPDVMQVDYEFPATKANPGVHLTWYHGVGGPGLDGMETYKGFGSAVMFVGGCFAAYFIPKVR